MGKSFKLTAKAPAIVHLERGLNRFGVDVEEDDFLDCEIFACKEQKRQESVPSCQNPNDQGPVGEVCSLFYSAFELSAKPYF